MKSSGRHICWMRLPFVPRRRRRQCTRHFARQLFLCRVPEPWSTSVPDRWCTPDFARRELRRLAELAQQEDLMPP